MGPSSLRPEVCRLLTSYGWRLTNAEPITMDPWSYRDYVRASRGEFTVAKDQNVRLRSGWFSEPERVRSGRRAFRHHPGHRIRNRIAYRRGAVRLTTTDDVLAAFAATRSYTGDTATLRARSPLNTSGPRLCLRGFLDNLGW